MPQVTSSKENYKMDTRLQGYVFLWLFFSLLPIWKIADIKWE